LFVFIYIFIFFLTSRFCDVGASEVDFIMLRKKTNIIMLFLGFQPFSISILRIPYTAHVTNEEVRRRTGQPPVTSTIVARRLRLFGHIARADPSQDHSRALQAAINRLPTDWRRRRGRSRQTWLRTIESDLQPTNLGLNSAWLRAQDRSKWRSVVDTAMLTAGRATL